MKPYPHRVESKTCHTSSQHTIVHIQYLHEFGEFFIGEGECDFLAGGVGVLKVTLERVHQHRQLRGRGSSII